MKVHVYDKTGRLVGPAPTRLRFCVNSESLVFVDAQDPATLAE